MSKDTWKGRAIQKTVRLLACLSFSKAQLLGRIAGRLMWWLRIKSARDCLTNIEHCFPTMDREAQRQLAKTSLLHTGMTVAEWGALWTWPTDQVMALINSVEGADLLCQDGQENQQGILLLSPHLGNWEMGGLYIGQQCPVSILYQPPKIPQLETFITEARSRTGAELLPTDKRGVVTLFQILRRQGVIGILPDQEPETSGGVFAPFFGIPANTIKLVSKLIQKTHPKVITICAYRLPSSAGFKLVIEAANPAIYQDDLLTSVTALNQTIEHCVLKAPEQYQWVYKRFKRRPDGQRHFYD